MTNVKPQNPCRQIQCRLHTLMVCLSYFFCLGITDFNFLSQNRDRIQDTHVRPQYHHSQTSCLFSLGILSSHTTSSLPLTHVLLRSLTHPFSVLPPQQCTHTSTSSFICSNSLYQHSAWVGRVIFINMLMYHFEFFNNSYYKRQKNHFTVVRTEECTSLAQGYIANKR